MIDVLKRKSLINKVWRTNKRKKQIRILVQFVKENERPKFTQGTLGNLPELEHGPKGNINETRHLNTRPSSV